MNQLTDEIDRLRRELASERIARLLAESAQAVASVGSWEWDVRTDEVSWSAELYRMHGLEVGTDLSRYEHALLLVHVDDRERLHQAVAKAVSDARPIRIDYRIVRPDGVERLLHGRVEVITDDHGAVVKLFGTATDLTEREAQRALECARADLHHLVERLPVGAIVSHDGVWVYVNQLFARALGRTREDLVGRGPFDFLHPDDVESVRERMRALATGVDPNETLERRFMRADGQFATFEVTPTTLADFEGRPAVLVMARDITEQKKLLAERLLTERLVTVGTLAAGIAHEINNPLSYITVNLDVLAEDLDDLVRVNGPERFTEIANMVSDAREGAERVRKIVSGLRAFSRAEDEKRTYVDVRRVIDSAIDMTSHEIRHRARLVKEYGDDTAGVIADQARLGQVFINVLVNAAQSIPEGNAEKNEIRITTRTEGGCCVVEVRDTGSGIPENLLPRLFDPFVTTKAIGAGQGLGLSICHGIVTSLGGRIDVETRVGKGTCFRVSLPLAPAAAAIEVPALRTRRNASLPSARVLLVEDEVAVATAMKRVLRGHDVTCLHSGAAAMDQLRCVESNYDVILCDLMMPQMSGMDVYEVLSTQGSAWLDRIVFLTGGVFTTRARQFLDEVPNRRLEKPIDAQQLRAVVEEFIR